MISRDLGKKRVKKVQKIMKSDGTRMFKISNQWHDISDDNVSMVMFVFVHCCCRHLPASCLMGGMVMGLC